MKKLILLLALALGVEVKGQIVGGYLPLNSTKSTTIGAVRTNSLVVTASTISVGAKTLTAGNTGTVAVLSDAVFPLQFSQGSSSPADASTYYFGQMSSQQSGNPLVGIVYIPYNSTLVGWSFSSYVSSVAGSAETATLSVRINNTTDVQLSSTINYSLASGYNNYNGTGLSTSIAAGDYLNIKLVTPTWVTNPTLIFSGVTLWFVRRS